MELLIGLISYPSNTSIEESPSVLTMEIKSVSRVLVMMFFTTSPDSKLEENEASASTDALAPIKPLNTAPMPIMLSVFT